MFFVTEAPMIMTQEQPFLKAHEQLQSLIAFIQQAPGQHLRLDQVERGLFPLLLQLGLSLLQAHVAAAGDGDVGEAVTTPDGQAHRRLPAPHPRTYRSIFGELSIRRFVYGSREGQAITHVPLDAALGLPAGEFSYVLEDWCQRLCVQDAFHEAVRSLHDLLGLRPSVRSLEQMNQTLGDVAADFAWQQPAPPPAEEGAVLVVTADGKGVPMRRPEEAPPAAHRRRKKGEKANKKQMAYVGAAYTIAPWVRTAEDVVDEVRRRQRAKGRPLPQHKQVWAEMTEVQDGEVLNGRSGVFGLLAQTAAQRNPGRAKPVVCLMDGEAALWDECRVWFDGAVGILDLFHALERLWAVAHCFHPEGSEAAGEFVTERLRMLLNGKVGSVIRGLRRLATAHGLKGQRRQTVRRAAGYFENNRGRMRYDEYLAAGYPIGSGVAEGACRHLVKDRMERAGMRWTVAGAQAMLRVRAVYLNGDWEAFLEERVRAEQERLYGTKAQEPEWRLAV
jgi:hypothetical protein